MPEWSIGAVSKTVVRVTGPGVRIPLSPQPGMDAGPSVTARHPVLWEAKSELVHDEPSIKQGSHAAAWHSYPAAGSSPGIMSPAQRGEQSFPLHQSIYMPL